MCATVTWEVSVLVGMVPRAGSDVGRRLNQKKEIGQSKDKESCPKGYILLKINIGPVNVKTCVGVGDPKIKMTPLPTGPFPVPIPEP
jgi:hypothetical protein